MSAVVPDRRGRAGRATSPARSKDIWTYGTKAIRDQSAALKEFAAKIETDQPGLLATVQKAQAATDAFATWLDAQAPGKTAASGIGVENYNWYLKNVQLAPYTWQDEVTLMERELGRSSAALAVEEQKNAKLPLQIPIATAAEHDQRYGAAVYEWRSSRTTTSSRSALTWTGGCGRISAASRRVRMSSSAKSTRAIPK